MQPGCWHSVGAGGACQFAPTRESLQKIQSFLARYGSALRLLAAVGGLAAGPAGAALGFAAADVAAAKGELGETSKLLAELEKLTTTRGLDPDGAPLDTKPHRHSGVDLIELKRFLENLSFPKEPFGGLQRVRTPENHILWLCPEHAETYRKTV
jgi:hypothetical protein